MQEGDEHSGDKPKHIKTEMKLESGGPDLEGVKFPQDDPLVITPIIENCHVKRVFIDSGASVDILFYGIFLEIKYNDSQLTPSDAPIYGFNRVKCQVLPIEYMDVRKDEEYRGKPAKDLVTYIGTSLEQLLKGKLTNFLQDNNDVFALTAAEMSDIDLNLITYRLNVDPSRKAVKQKKGTYAPDRLEAIKQDVEKFLEAGIIEEVQFREQLDNSVMVKKANGKWRMYIYFTNLNDACLKDCYPLPRIDTLIDATAGHKVLSFMEGFSGYYQIKMHKNDTSKAFFIIDFGVFFYLVMAFGLKNAGTTCQRLVNKIFVHPIEKTTEVYVDYMLVKILAKSDKIDHLREAFEVLRHHKMRLNPVNPDTQPLRRKFHGSKDSGRLIKWKIELDEFDIKYKPQTSIKAQALVDFVVECTINNQEVGERSSNPGRKRKDDEDLTLKEYWVLYFDRTSKTKFSGAGLVLQSLDGFIIEYALKLDFLTTNNEAEYEELIAVLGLARAMRDKNHKIRGDSRLVVAQVNGEFESKDDIMAKYSRVMKEILTQFDEWYAEHVPREENITADALSKFVSFEIENYPREALGRPKSQSSVQQSKRVRMTPTLPPKEERDSDEEEAEKQKSTFCGACHHDTGVDKFWICCDVCERWFHGTCVKVTPAKAKHIKHYECPICSNKKAKVY
ncbi:hypothetical protein AgCh_000945 [Apium graveolens]